MNSFVNKEKAIDCPYKSLQCTGFNLNRTTWFLRTRLKFKAIFLYKMSHQRATHASFVPMKIGLAHLP